MWMRSQQDQDMMMITWWWWRVSTPQLVMDTSILVIAAFVMTHLLLSMMRISVFQLLHFFLIRTKLIYKSSVLKAKLLLLLIFPGNQAQTNGLVHFLNLLAAQWQCCFCSSRVNTFALTSRTRLRSNGLFSTFKYIFKGDIYTKKRFLLFSPEIFQIIQFQQNNLLESPHTWLKLGKEGQICKTPIANILWGSFARNLLKECELSFLPHNLTWLLGIHLGNTT